MDNTTRVFFIGDELVAGYGDARALGWTGRVLARTESDPPILAFNLSIPEETSEELAKRWQDEVSRRIHRDSDNRLVIGIGTHDLDRGISLARARLHVANILDSAERLHLRCFVVGPPPRIDVPQRIQTDYTRALAEVCRRREVPFVDCYTPLLTHEQWNTDMSISGAYTPHQAGYGLIAWLVLHMGWHNWLGVPHI